MHYQWDFAVVFNDIGLLLTGLVGTLKITGAALAFGLPLGLLLAFARMSGRRVLTVPVGFFIELFRTTPPLVQLFWVFFVLPILIRVRMGPLEAAVITFSLQSSAFFAEVFRAGIQSIARGQWEAGRALGMNHAALMRRIILPQAVRRMIPAFLNRVIELMKTTSLVASIAYADLLYQAMMLSQSTYRPLEVFTTAAALYFVVLFALSLASRGLERRLARAG